MQVQITEERDFDEIVKSMKKLGAATLNIGLPPKAGGRLLMILAIQEHGSPLLRIPARPVVRPALASSRARGEIASALLSAAEAAWHGDDPGMRSALEAAGRAGADAIRAYIDSGALAPNSPVTVSGGWIRNRAARKAVHIPGKGSGRPLVDTGALYGAFDYELEE